MVDIDPGFTQFWYDAGLAGANVDGHDVHFTIGELIGTDGCPIPTGGIDWLPVRQPVVLDDWPAVAGGEVDRFTTIASWRGPLAPVQHGGRTYGIKVHEFRKFLDVARRSPHAFEIALDIHPDDQGDLDALREHGWRIVDPRAVAGDPQALRGYVQGSGAEFSVAQEIYVETRCGWFSDRSACYLAAGRPVILQATGFEDLLPTGRGLFAVKTAEEAADAIKAVRRDYALHAAAARSIAQDHFDSAVILGRLLAEAGIGDA